MNTSLISSQARGKILYSRGSVLAWRESSGPIWVMVRGGLALVADVDKNAKVGLSKHGTELKLKFSSAVDSNKICAVDLLSLDSSIAGFRKLKRTSPGLVRPNYLLGTPSGYVYKDLLANTNLKATYNNKGNQLSIHGKSSRATSSIWRKPPPLTTQQALCLEWYISNVALVRTQEVSALKLHNFVKFAQAYLETTVIRSTANLLESRYLQLYKQVQSTTPSEENIHEWSRLAARLGWWEMYIRSPDATASRDLAWFHAIEPPPSNAKNFKEVAMTLVPLLSEL